MVNKALSNWVKAAKKAGYLQSGKGFKKLPKKGSPGYKKIKNIYNKMSCSPKSKRKSSPKRRRKSRKSRRKSCKSRR